ncbi:MAG: hypothetical protein GY940_47615 [bacterium]|nr:hypothetical protein [bacterium]
MKIKSYVFNNFGLKVTALFLALFVWVVISGKERSNSERIVEANVEYFNANEDKGITVSSVRPDKVRLTVRGTSKELEKIAPGDFKVMIDLIDVTEGTRLNYFTEDHLQYPEKIKPVSIYPKMIELTVKEFITREVPIRVRYKGSLPAGIVLRERRLEPDKVKIFGDKPQISSITHVEAADQVNLQDINGDRVLNLQLKKSNEIIRFKGTDSVDVHITVENKNAEKPDVKKIQNEKKNSKSQAQKH